MFCQQCGKELTTQANFCSACGAPAPGNPNAYARPRILRPRHPRVIAGVCAGIALHYGWDVALTRILVVAFTVFTGGLGVIVYIAAWILIPDAPYTLPIATNPSSV